MPAPHLAAGSEQPPKTDAKLLRLYSMEYCPYAQRIRLVLRAKNIPFETVNINLSNKPEWYMKINPKGLVPALDTGSDIIVESTDIADYLDEKYPENPLYPKDPSAKKHDQELIKKITPITSTFYRCLFKKENKTLNDWVKEFISLLQVFENELASRGTVFFGGEKPGMVDFMLWPWGERAGTIKIAWDKQLPLEQNQIPLLRKWRKAMRENPVCDEFYHEPEKHWKVVLMKMKNTPLDVDNI